MEDQSVNATCEIGDTFQYFFVIESKQFIDRKQDCESLEAGGSLALPTDQQAFDDIIAIRDLSGSTAQAYVGLIDPNGPKVGTFQGGITDRFQSIVDGSISAFTSGAFGENPWRDAREPEKIK